MYSIYKLCTKYKLINYYCTVYTCTCIIANNIGTALLGNGRRILHYKLFYPTELIERREKVNFQSLSKTEGKKAKWRRFDHEFLCDFLMCTKVNKKCSGLDEESSFSRGTVYVLLITKSEEQKRNFVKKNSKGIHFRNVSVKHFFFSFLHSPQKENNYVKR